MSLRICTNGHRFEKTSNCPVCPECSAEEMKNKYAEEFPALGAPAFRALDGIGVKQLSDLTKFTANELLATHGFGPKALRLLKEKMAEQKLGFAKED